ncbi:hypothetical protein A4R35_01335 [Thermogemmatispora tikiterensis]|uniref:Luciferase domain-containing protein n=2 Tax=Thermogemmatispora tikiterensis TaxID=1825093 RepID=A0A328V940_9CHLR|nr:hypothetical protein A4R35_01335 [Thermogemmatispora tikiterensis]
MKSSYGYLPPSLRRLPVRQGERPLINPRYPCLQDNHWAPPRIREQFLRWLAKLEGVSLESSDLPPAAQALVLAEHLAKGKPEAFIRGKTFAIVRADGSVHLLLEPAWGQKVLDKGWGSVHPLARYMAGAIPPQSLILYAPRDQRDLAVLRRIILAAYSFACGRIGTQILPDTAW